MNSKPNYLNLIVVFFVSLTVISLQIFFMRSLAITKYHHFSYLIIGIALLGFGSSGTFLAFWGEYFKKNYFTLSQQNFSDLTQLFSDLESVKKYLNYLKRQTWNYFSGFFNQFSKASSKCCIAIIRGSCCDGSISCKISLWIWT